MTEDAFTIVAILVLLPIWILILSTQEWAHNLDSFSQIVLIVFPVSTIIFGFSFIMKPFYIKLPQPGGSDEEVVE